MHTLSHAPAFALALPLAHGLALALALALSLAPALALPLSLPLPFAHGLALALARARPLALALALPEGSVCSDVSFSTDCHVSIVAVCVAGIGEGSADEGGVWVRSVCGGGSSASAARLGDTPHIRIGR